MKPYRYVHLSDLEKETLEECYKNHEKSHVRIRSQSLLLSNVGWKKHEIAELHQKLPDTIRDWLNNWECKGISGVMIAKGRGRKSILSLTNPEEVALVKKKS
jgi:transposase